jgi:5-methylcytosine-specific restriction endonuclease McrA
LRRSRLPQEQDTPQANDFRFPAAFLLLLHQGVGLGQRLEAVVRVAQVIRDVRQIASCSGKCRPLLCCAGVAITFLLPTHYKTSMSTYLSTELRQQLVEADDHPCAYCQTTEANTGQPMVVDHIIPESQGSQTTCMVS